MSVYELAKILPPPNNPAERGRQADWVSLDTNLVVELPADYKEFIDLYGTGSIDDFLWILNPFSSNKNVNLVDQIAIRLDALRTLEQDFEEEVPFPLYPDEGGILPCAFTDNGDVVCWITVGDPSTWRVVVNASRTPDWEQFDETLTGFVAKLLTRKLRVRCFPDDFPSALPLFEHK